MARNFLGHYGKKLDKTIEKIEELDECIATGTPYKRLFNEEEKVAGLLQLLDKAKFYNKSAWCNCELSRDEYIENIEILNYVEVKYDKGVK